MKGLLERPTTSLGTSDVIPGVMSNANLLQVPGSGGHTTLLEGRKRSGSVPVVKITLAVAWQLKVSFLMDEFEKLN